jgi:hypothetical protein
MIKGKQRLRRVAAGCLAICLSLTGLLPTWSVQEVRAAVTNEKPVYTDGLAAGFADHSWAEHSLEETKTVHQGTSSIRFNPSFDGGLYLYSQEPLLVSELNTLQFWIHGGGQGQQQMNVVIQAGGEPVAKVDLSQYLESGGLQADAWQKVQIDLTPLRIPNGVYDGILLRDKSQGQQGNVYIDDVSLLFESVPVSNKPPAPVYEQLTVFDSKLNAGFHNYSWGSHSLTEQATVHSDVYAMMLQPGWNAGLYLYKDRILSTNEYTTLEFWIHGGTTGGQQVDLMFQAGGDPVVTIDLNDYLSHRTIQSGLWEKVTIPLDELPVPNAILDGFLFVGRGDQEQGKLYLDDMVLTKEVYQQPQRKDITFGRTSLLMYNGNSELPVVTSNFDNGYSERVTHAVYWASSESDVVSVNGGVLQAHRTGTSVVTATYDSFEAQLEVKVIEALPETVYDDQLQNNYDNWSWGKVDLQNSSVVHSGMRSIRFQPHNWTGVYLNHDEPYAVQDYYGYEFYVHGGDKGGQKLRFVVQDGNSILGSVVLDDILPYGIKAGEWTKVTVRLSDLGLTDGYFDSFVFQAWDWKEQPAVYLDDVKLLRFKDRIQNPKPPVTNVSVQIDTTQNRRAVNPDIYGVNYEEIPPEDVSSFTQYPVVRWGGNAATRYNWEANVQNHAADWFYMNLPKEISPNETLPHGSRTDRLIDQTLGDGGKMLLQVPTIGWTPKDRQLRVGFSVNKYGAQQQTECSYGGWWCNPDAGNGVSPGGQPITGNDPNDTSTRVGPDFITRWMDHIQSRVGDKVNYYALDNEPMLWPYTHRDIHPEKTTYDEIWRYTQAYGQAIKDKDPDSQIFGPVVWGWCAYFYSAADGCSSGPDRQSHGGKPFLEWFLEQVRGYENQRGTRLIDYLDIHYYPTEAGVAITTDESSSVAARRLKSLKALYDPSFRDSSSWIGEPVNLIPRMKEIINKTAPGTKLAITEYNFGNGRGISSGLAQAEAMAIFGREGVDLATRWGQPLANTPVEDAFKLYLDYDGKGSRVQGDSVKTESSHVDMVGAYSIQGSDGKLYMLLFNKDTAPKVMDMKVAGTSLRQGEVYRFDSTNRLSQAGTMQLQNQFSIEVPARSATLIVGTP